MKYFLHDCNAFDDEKITELYMSFGYEGLGLFYTILEKIGKQEKPIKTTILKAQLNVGKRLEKCWLFMEEIGIISSSDGETFNERILSYSEMYEIKNEKSRERQRQFRERQRNNKKVTGDKRGSNGAKVKGSKVKGSKDIIQLAFASDVFKKAWDEWVLFRNQKRQKLTELTIKKQNNFLGKFDEQTAIGILNQSIEKGWTGLFEINNTKDGTDNNHPSGSKQKLGTSDARIETARNW